MPPEQPIQPSSTPTPDPVVTPSAGIQPPQTTVQPTMTPSADIQPPQPVAQPVTMPTVAPNPAPTDGAMGSAPPAVPNIAPSTNPIQPITNSSQPGYVPPVTPAQSLKSSFLPGRGKGGALGKLRIVVIVVVALGLLSGVGIFVKDLLFTGSSISSSDLIEETVSDTTFKHPKQWTKVEEADFNAAYTEGGQKLKESDQGMVVASEKIAVNYDSLSQEQQDQFYTQFEKSFNDKQDSLFGSDSGCQEVSDVKVAKGTQKNYTLAIDIGYTCGKFSGRNISGKFKAVLGIKGYNMSIVGIGAIDKTWDKSGAALDEILSTFKPAE